MDAVTCSERRKIKKKCSRDLGAWREALSRCIAVSRGVCGFQKQHSLALVCKNQTWTGVLQMKDPLRWCIWQMGCDVLRFLHRNSCADNKKAFAYLDKHKCEYYTKTSQSDHLCSFFLKQFAPLRTGHKACRISWGPCKLVHGDPIKHGQLVRSKCCVVGEGLNQHGFLDF